MLKKIPENVDNNQLEKYQYQKQTNKKPFQRNAESNREPLDSKERVLPLRSVTCYLSEEKNCFVA